MGVGGGSGGGGGSYGGDPAKIAAAMLAKLEHNLQISQGKQSNIVAEGDAKRQAVAARGAQQVVNAQLRAQQQLEANEQKHQQRLLQQQQMFAQRQAQIAAQQARNQPSFGDRMENLQRTGYYNVAAGAALTSTITAPLIGGAVVVSKAAIDWESSFAGVRKTVDATEAQLQTLAQQLRDMAAGPNPIPIDVNELNAIAEAAGQLGIQTPNIAAFTRTVADLGQTTNLTSDQAATGMARLANITQMPQDQFDRLGSTLVDLGNKFASTESEIMSMSLRIAGAGKQVGLSEDEILSFATALSSVGLRADAGGSAVSRMFITLESASREGGEKLALIGKVAGSTGAEFKKAFQDDAAGALQSFLQGIKRFGDEGGNVFGVLKDLGLNEIRVRDAILRAANAGDLLSDALKIGSDAWRANNALTTEAEKRYATTASQLQILKNRATEVAIEWGARLLPTINNVADSLGERMPHAIDVLVESWEGLPAPMQDTLKVLLLLLALAGPVKLLAGNVMILGSALGSIGAATGITTLLTALRAMSSVGAIRNVSDLRAAAQLSGIGVAAGGAAIGVTALAAAASAGYIIWQNYQARIDDAAIAQHNLEVSSDNLKRSLDRALQTAGSNSKAAESVKQIQDAVVAAGDDVTKFESAFKRIRDARLEVKSMGLSPVAEQMLLADYERIKRDIESRKIQIEFEPIGTETIGEQTWRGITGKDASSNQGGWSGWTGQIGEWTALPSLAVANAIGGAYNWATGGGSQPEPKPAATSGEPAKVFTAPGVKSDQANANKTVDIAKATYGQLQQILDDYNKRAAGGEQLAWGDQQRFRQALTQRDKMTAANKAAADKERLAQQQNAADAATERERIEAETEERLRRIRAKALQEQLQLWERYGGAVEGILGRIQEFGGEETKTQKTAMQAQMMKREFADIPPHLKAVVVGLGAIHDKMRELTETRDAMRGLFQDMWKNALVNGADTSALQQSAAFMEKRLDYERRMKAMHGRAVEGGKSVLEFVEAQKTAKASELEAVQESGHPGAVAYGPDRAQQLAGGRRPPREHVAPGNNGMPPLIRPTAPQLAPMPISRLKPVGSVPALKVRDERQLSTPNPQDYDGSLLGLGVPQGWGQAVTKYGMAPGESRQWRQRVQEWLTDSKAVAKAAKEAGMTVDDFAAAWRRIADKSDASDEIAAAGDRTREALKAAGQKIRLAGKEDNPYLALMDAMEQGDYNRESPEQRKQLLGATLGGMVAGATADVQKFIDSEADKQKVIAAGAPYLQGATADLYEYERATALTQKRVELWAKYKPFRDAADKMQEKGNIAGAQSTRRAANTMFREENATFVEGYNAEEQARQAREAAAATLEFTAATGSLIKQRSFLDKNAGASEEAIAEGLQRVTDYETKLAQLRNTYGKAEAERLAKQYQSREAVLRQLRRQNDAWREYDKLTRDSAESVALQTSLQGIMRATPSYSPDRARQIAEETERRRLVAEAAGNPGKTGMVGSKLLAFMDEFDAKAKTGAVDAFTGRLGELDRELAGLGDTTGLALLKFDLMYGQFSQLADKGQLLSKTIRNLSMQMQMDNNKELLTGQSQFRAQFNTSNRSKVEEEIKLRDAINAATGKGPSDENLLRQQKTGDSIRLNAADKQDEYERVNRQLGARVQLQLSLVDSAAARVTLEQQLAKQMRDYFGQTQTDADARREAVERVAAEEEDRFNRIRDNLDTRRQLELDGVNTAKERVEIEQRYMDQLRAQLDIKEDDDYRERKAQEQRNADLEDAVERTRRGADMMRDAIRTGLEDGFSAGLQSLADRLKDKALDMLATTITNRLSQGMLDAIGGGEDPMLDARRGRFPTTGGFAGPFVPTAQQFPQNFEGIGSMAYIAAQRGAGPEGGQMVSDMTVNAASVTINGGAGGLAPMSDGGTGKPTARQKRNTFLRGVLGGF